MSFRVFFLAIVIVWGVEALLLASTIVEGKPPVSKSKSLSSPTKEGGGVSMRVLWTVSNYKVGENATWGKEDAQKMLFKPLDIDATTITFDGQMCHDVIFERESVNTEKYLAQLYHTTPQALGINEEIAEVVKTNCCLPGFAKYICLKDRRIIIHLNGVFFYLEPVVDY